jgi:predicted amidophosphoribosyltransferase
MRALKNDSFVNDPPVLISDWIGETLRQTRFSSQFDDFFHPDTILVPIPKSSLMRAHTLWVPSRIASALLRNGFGTGVTSYLERIKAVRKASTSLPQDRPKAAEHFQSFAVRGSLPHPQDIVLVDDIVTRGATFFGAAERLIEAFPNVSLRAFAAMRTISDPSKFTSFLDPHFGKVEYRGGSLDTVKT